MQPDCPIGVFDSGFGGLTVARALIDLLPQEQIIYVGDTGRYPYGPRPASEICSFSHEIVDYLVRSEGVKMVVVACNTASSFALDELRESFSVPILGVIEPGLRSALRATRNGSVGVIGTVGTIASGAYQNAAKELGATTNVYCYACPGFVEFVERGEFGTDQVHILAERLLEPLVHLGVDTLLLGCTHYPYLARTIADVMGREVLLISSAEETAFDVRAMLGTSRTTNATNVVRRHRFLSSGDTTWFAQLGGQLLGPELAHAEHIIFGS
jgi:glutamate racemase